MSFKKHAKKHAKKITVIGMGSSILHHPDLLIGDTIQELFNHSVFAIVIATVVIGFIELLIEE